MKLYGSPFSPYARKARVLILEKKIDCEFVDEDPWSAASGIPAMNPFGKVPVLQIGPDNYLFESALIVHYLDHLEGRPLPPAGAPDYWQSQWYQALGNGMIDATIARVLETRRPAARQMPEKIEREEARITRAFATARSACQGGQFLVGAKFSLADLVLGVAFQYMDIRYPHDWRSAHPVLAGWFAGIGRRPSFMQTMPPGFSPIL